MSGAIFVLFLLPWLDRAEVKSIRYRGGIYKKALLLFVVSFIGLGYLGTQAPSPSGTIMARVFSIIYFGFFLLMPIYTRWEKFKKVPDRLTPQPTIEERIPVYKKTFDEVTQKKTVTLKDGRVINLRTPNPSGLCSASVKLVKKMKESLD